MIGTVFKAWVKNFINLFYPLSCLICKAALSPLSDKPLCEICWNKIEFSLPPFCRVCGKHLPAGNQNHAFICRDCQARVYSFKKARSVCVYDGVIKECIHLFKYKSKLSLVKPLSKLMINFAHKFLDMRNVDSIIPVPLHSAKQRQRRFNQAKLLAGDLAGAFSKELQANLLIKIKSGPAQVNLLRTERLKNVRGAFKVKDARPLENKNILLVDDVLTTGATANECARTLLDAGANRIDAFVLARGR